MTDNISKIEIIASKEAKQGVKDLKPEYKDPITKEYILIQKNKAGVFSTPVRQFTAM